MEGGGFGFGIGTGRVLGRAFLEISLSGLGGVRIYCTGHVFEYTNAHRRFLPEGRRGDHVSRQPVELRGSGTCVGRTPTSPLCLGAASVPSSRENALPRRPILPRPSLSPSQILTIVRPPPPPLPTNTNISTVTPPPPLVLFHLLAPSPHPKKKHTLQHNAPAPYRSPPPAPFRRSAQSVHTRAGGS